MDFKNESRLEHPAKDVLDLMIHNLDKVVPFMPTIDYIETEKFERRDNGQIYILRKWKGRSETAPKALKPFLSEAMLTWHDDALWTPEEYKVDWSLRSSMGKLYECGGTNSFGPHPDDQEKASLIRLTGTLTIYPDRIPGIPKFIARRVAPQVEAFILKLVSPNLTEVVNGLEGYLASQKTS
jgi:hypothetical protein